MATLLPTPRSLLRVAPHRGEHWVALRAAICVLVPLLLCAVSGHSSWTVYASFGAFTALYGRFRGYRERARMQAGVAVLLVAAVVTGTVTALGPAPRWTAVPVAAVWAVLAGLASDAARWHPPGALFVVFAYAVCAQLPRAAADVPAAFAVSAAAAVFAVLVGSAGAPLPWSAPHADEGPPPGLRAALHRPGALASAVRLGGAVVLAGGIAAAGGLGHGWWAVVAAVVPMAAPDTPGRLSRAVQRALGTAAGLALAAPLLALHPAIVPLVLLIAVLQALAELLVGRNYALALVFVTPLALLVGQLGRPQPAHTLLRDRALETLLGIVAAVALTLLTHDRRPPAASDA